MMPGYVMVSVSMTIPKCHPFRTMNVGIAMHWVGGQAIRMETLLSYLLQLRTVSIDNVGANKDLKWHVANWSPCNM